MAAAYFLLDPELWGDDFDRVRARKFSLKSRAAFALHVPLKRGAVYLDRDAFEGAYQVLVRVFFFSLACRLAERVRIEKAP